MAMKAFLAAVVMLMLVFTLSGIATAKTAYAANDLQPSIKFASMQGSSLTTEAAFAPKISKKQLSLVYGKATTLKVTGNNGKKVTWKSSNTKIVQVKAKGTSNAKLTAKKAGTATITATVGGKKLTCKVTVKGKLNKTKLTMTSFDLANLKLNGATAKSWSSSDTKHVKVSKKGKVYAGGFSGSAVITCTDTLGNKYRCTVTMNFPSLKCEMLGTTTLNLSTTWYFKRFKLTNWTGKTVVLNKSLMIYYPYGGTSPEDLMLGHNSVHSTSDFTESPETVPNGYSYQFVGFEGDYDSYYPAYSGRTFSMALSVNGRSFFCIFETDGDLMACQPADLD